MLTHTIIGPLVLSAALYSFSVMIAGQTIDARVTDKTVYSDSENGDSYGLKYKYEYNNRDYHGSGAINRSSYETINVGDHVGIKVLPAMPDFGQQLLEGNNPLFSTLFLFGFGVFWTLFMLIPMKEFYVVPFIENKVMKNGKVCAGKITQKNITGDDNVIYTLYYEYEPSPVARFSDKAVVSKSQYEVAYIGEPVNVVYDDVHPKTSVLFRYSNFELAAQVKK